MITTEPVSSAQHRRRPAGGGSRGLWRIVSGLVAIGLVGATVVVLLHRSGVPVRAAVVFLGVELVARVVPGALLWRWLRPGRDPWLAALVLGAVVVHAASVPWYLLVRFLGVPFAVWVLPVLIVVAVLSSRSARGRVLAPSPTLPWWFGLNVAAAVAGAVLLLWNHRWLSSTGFRWVGTDYTYLLSLAGELRNHVPPTVPFVTGEPLQYHWFSLADVASTSWLAGQELDLLTIALMPVAMLIVGLVAFALLGYRFTGSATGGVVALWLAVCVGSLNPFGSFTNTIIDSTLLRISWQGSPTQAYAQVLAIAFLYVLIDVLDRRHRPHRADLVLLVLLVAVLAGAKATFIPVLGAGALLAAAVAWRQRLPIARRIFLVGVLLGCGLVFAQLVLFQGATQGMRVAAQDSLAQVATVLGLVEPGTVQLVAVGVLLLVTWLAPLVVAFGHRAEDDLEVGDPGRADALVRWWIWGMVASSIAAAILLTQPGFSQYFFLRAGLPFAYLLVAAALLTLWRLATVRVRWAAVGTGLLGLLLCRLLREGVDLADQAPGTADLLWPLATIVAATVLVGGIAAVSAAPSRRRTVAFLLAGTFTLGIGAGRTIDLADQLGTAPLPVSSLTTAPVVPPGGIEAARHVRDRSDPDDLFATNAHCGLPDQEPCRNAAFWMSAWAERRAVVEGWGFTARANATGDTLWAVLTAPFWDPELLALNDEVFLRPGQESLDALLERFAVRWLIVDRRFPADLPGLRKLMPVHQRFGEVVVFDVASAR